MTAFLGIDYGRRRVGIAAGDDQQHLAFALGTHVEGRDGSVLKYLAEITTERNIKTVVVGLPLTADGRNGEMAVAARTFSALLESRLDLDVVLWDERFSSAEADRWLAAKKQVTKEDRDALAAQIILQSYLDHLKATMEGERP